MKRFLFLLSLATALTGYAQEKPPVSPRNVVKVSPLTALGYVSVFYERVVAPRTSVVVGVGFGGESYRYENNSTKVPEPGQFRYQRLTLEGRRYLSKKRQAPFGFFVGGYGRYTRLWVRDYTFDKDKFVRDAAGNLVLFEKQTTVTTLGGYVGWQTRLFRRLTFEAFQGMQVQLPAGGVVFTQSIPEAMSKAGVVGRLGLTIGYSF